MIKTGECVACKSNVEINSNYEDMSSFYTCPVCGRYELHALDNFMRKVENQLASYLLYHRFGKIGMIEYRYNTSLDKETCDKYNKEFNSGQNTHGRPVHMNADMIAAWYPKSFAERIDMILLYINSRISHIGQCLQGTFNRFCCKEWRIGFLLPPCKYTESNPSREMPQYSENAGEW